MKPKTVNEVIAELQQLNRRGYGEHILLVSNDEECNGYHELYGWYADEGEPFRYRNEQTKQIETRPTVRIS